MTKQVLLVEDEPEIREVLAECLLDDGHVVVTAPNGEAALEYLEANSHPGLILADLRMPVMTGEQLVLELRQRPHLAGIPVVFVSAEPSARSIAARLGVREVLTKPIDIDLLLVIVRRYLAT